MNALLNIYIPFILFAAVHYFILQKMLKQRFPFSNLRKSTKPTDEGNTIFAYIILGISSFIMLILLGVSLLTGIFPSQLRDNLSVLLTPLGESTNSLLIAIFITTILLLFSKKFFAKPVKETWKAIVLAGIIAGTASVALSYGLWKFVGPYLPTGTDKAQSATENITPNS